jgi:hypothetical protein
MRAAVRRITQGGSRGPELVANGEFLVDLTGWTTTPVGTGAASTWNNGRADVPRVDASNYSRVLQQITCEVGPIYELKVKGEGPNGLFVRIGTSVGGSQVLSDAVMEGGAPAVYQWPAAQTAYHLTIRGRVAGVSNFIERVSVRKVL